MRTWEKAAACAWAGAWSVAIAGTLRYRFIHGGLPLAAFPKPDVYVEGPITRRGIMDSGDGAFLSGVCALAFACFVAASWDWLRCFWDREWDLYQQDLTRNAGYYFSRGCPSFEEWKTKSGMDGSK